VSEDDKARFQHVVVPHLQDAFAMARWLAGSASDAEDIVQDACLRAYRSIAGFRGDNPRAWVMKIVRNTTFTWLRKHRDPTLVGLENFEDDGDGKTLDIVDPTNPEVQLIEHAEAARLESAIANLPPVFRETLVLRELQGFDYRAIGEITGVPIGTVMSRLARARRHLIKALGSSDAGSGKMGPGEK
jgi:RNA polymerase sigma factor (sigma-70 family)